LKISPTLLSHPKKENPLGIDMFQNYFEGHSQPQHHGSWSVGQHVEVISSQHHHTLAMALLPPPPAPPQLAQLATLSHIPAMQSFLQFQIEQFCIQEIQQSCRDPVRGLYLGKAMVKEFNRTSALLYNLQAKDSEINFLQQNVSELGTLNWKGQIALNFSWNTLQHAKQLEKELEMRLQETQLANEQISGFNESIYRHINCFRRKIKKVKRSCQEDNDGIVSAHSELAELNKTAKELAGELEHLEKVNQDFKKRAVIADIDSHNILVQRPGICATLENMEKELKLSEKDLAVQETMVNTLKEENKELQIQLEKNMTCEKSVIDVNKRAAQDEKSLQEVTQTLKAVKAGYEQQIKDDQEKYDELEMDVKMVVEKIWERQRKETRRKKRERVYLFALDNELKKTLKRLKKEIVPKKQKKKKRQAQVTWTVLAPTGFECGGCEMIVHLSSK